MQADLNNTDKLLVLKKQMSYIFLACLYANSTESKFNIIKQIGVDMINVQFHISQSQINRHRVAHVC